MSSTKAAEGMTDQEVIDQTAELIREWWAEELSAGRNVTAARAALERFAKMYFKGEIGVSGGRENWDALGEVVKRIERVLAVDLDDPKNRRGEIPEALGLVSRAKDEAIHHVVVRAVDHVRYYTGVPGRALDRSAELVADALQKVGMFPHLTDEAIRKISVRAD